MSQHDIFSMTRNEIALLAIEKYGVPNHCADGLAGYICGSYKRPGHFLTALITNNLKETFSRADDINLQCIINYVKFLYNEAPSVCWGSKKNMNEWLDRSQEYFDNLFPNRNK